MVGHERVTGFPRVCSREQGDWTACSSTGTGFVWILRKKAKVPRCTWRESEQAVTSVDKRRAINQCNDIALKRVRFELELLGNVVADFRTGWLLLSERLLGLMFCLADVEAVSKILANAGQPALTTKNIVQRRHDVLSGVGELIRADRYEWLTGTCDPDQADSEPALRKAIPLEFQDTIFGQNAYPSEVSVPEVGRSFIRAVAERIGQTRFSSFERDEFTTNTIWGEVLRFWEKHELQPGIWLVYRAYQDCYSIVGFQRKLGREEFEDRDFSLAYMVFRDIVSLHRSVFCQCDKLSQRLPTRKRQVLELLLAGDSIKVIAAKMSLSRHTIGDHVKEIYRHFDVESRSELLSKFIAN